MNERTTTTITTSWQTALVKGVATTALAVSFIIPNPIISGGNLLRNRLTENSTSSMSASTKLWQQTRSERIRSLRGKYAFVKTTSDTFAQRKQEEINVEDK